MDLVEGTVARNPGNDKLRTFADWYLPEWDAADRPDPERPVHRDAGTDPERPGSEERAEPPPSGDNHASHSEILQIPAMVAPIPGFAVAIVALVVAVAGPAAWAQATFVMAAGAFLLSTVAFIYPEGRRGRLTKLAGALMALLLAVAIGASAVLVYPAPPLREVPPKVSLVSMRFEVGNWNPRLVDLRHATESGIPVNEGDHLELSDF